jgi:hypothetical protein
MLHRIRLKTGEYQTEIMIEQTLINRHGDHFIEEKLNEIFAKHIAYVEAKRADRREMQQGPRFEVFPGHTFGCGLYSHKPCDCGALT